MAENNTEDRNGMEQQQANAAADVEQVMRKFDRESNTRVWTGKAKIAVGVILALF